MNNNFSLDQTDFYAKTRQSVNRTRNESKLLDFLKYWPKFQIQNQMVPPQSSALPDTAGHSLPTHHTTHTLVYAHMACVNVAKLSSYLVLRRLQFPGSPPHFVTILPWYPWIDLLLFPFNNETPQGLGFAPHTLLGKSQPVPMASTTIWWLPICVQAQPVLWPPDGMSIVLSPPQI